MKTDNNLFKKVLSQKIELGRQVQIDYPDIVNEYRDIKNGIDNIVLNIMNRSLNELLFSRYIKFNLI